MYDINMAHEDGRHDSPHPEDRKFWAGQGCEECRDD